MVSEAVICFKNKKIYLPVGHDLCSSSVLSTRSRLKVNNGKIAQFVHLTNEIFQIKRKLTRILANTHHTSGFPEMLKQTEGAFNSGTKQV